MDPVCKDYFARVMFEEPTIYPDGMMTALSLAKQEGRRDVCKEVLSYMLYEPEKETETATSVRDYTNGGR